MKTEISIYNDKNGEVLLYAHVDVGEVDNNQGDELRMYYNRHYDTWTSQWLCYAYITSYDIPHYTIPYLLELTEEEYFQLSMIWAYPVSMEVVRWLQNYTMYNMDDNSTVTLDLPFNILESWMN